MRVEILIWHDDFQKPKIAYKHVSSILQYKLRLPKSKSHNTSDKDHAKESKKLQMIITQDYNLWPYHITSKIAPGI